MTWTQEINDFPMLSTVDKRHSTGGINARVVAKQSGRLGKAKAERQESRGI